MDEINRLLGENNYIAVGMLIRKSDIADGEKFEALGLAVSSVVDALSGEKNRERIVYLRSILSWFFREAPGLSHLYREQLRLIHGKSSAWQDFSNVFRFFKDLGGDTSKSEGATASDTYEKAKDFSERLKGKGEDFQEQVKDFFAQSGIDLDDGIKRANEFFDNLPSRGSDTSDRDRTESDEDS